ncbi:MAG: hypothetical protein EOO50_10260 [Flavobacterium sp.]|uniref:DUF5004 domain-containing protein n=1 Tax=Flavobacterium sp. TaxID=239 RepID=UPI0012139B69|nr:lipocalin family protein [Flavobacterium sp.]RZJ66306.1 MAG: hypothetical protein EOO50_10260 [Flavobacterium sp.]
MKKITYFLLALAGCMWAGCSSDDDGNNNNQNADIVGTYRMTAFNSPTAIDYDDDGDSSVNMMTESDCYNNTVMTLNEDGTFTSTYNGVGISSGVSSCASSVNSSGTWTRTGNTIATTTTAGGSGTNSWTWNSSGTTLSRTQANAQYPSINATTGDFEYGTGNVGYTYTLQ